MIIDKIENINNYSVEHKGLRKAFDYIKKTDLIKLPLGKAVIQGDDVFLNIIEYDPENDDNKEYEFHQQYIDIQIVLASVEHIWIGYDVDLINKSEYNEETDSGVRKGQPYVKLDLRVGYFLVAFPNDAHHFEYRDTDYTVRKLTMKVKL